MNIQLPDDELITDKELAEQWRCTTRTLRNYENQPDGLPAVIIAGRKWRPVRACQKWLAERVRRPNPSRKSTRAA